jgi:hypothetical protein
MALPVLVVGSVDVAGGDQRIAVHARVVRTAAHYRSGVWCRVPRAGLEGQRLDGDCGVSDTTAERITGTGRRRLISFAADRSSSTGILKGAAGPPAARKNNELGGYNALAPPDARAIRGNPFDSTESFRLYLFILIRHIGRDRQLASRPYQFGAGLVLQRGPGEGRP